MAHEIEGNKAFYVTDPAWHGLGTVLSDAPTIDEAWRLAYPHTLFKLDLEATITNGDKVERMPLKNSKVIVRDDGLELNSVGSDFELFQPYEVLDTFRPVLKSGLVKLEAGGSLRGGSQMWALGKVQNADADILPGDHVKGYVLMFTGFDGSLRVGMSQTNVRVVCANTLALAVGTKGQNADYKFKHTKNIRLRIDDAMTTIKHTLDNFQKTTEAYKVLAAKKVSQGKQQDYIANVFLTVEELLEPEKISTKKANTVQYVVDLLDTQRGLEYVPAIRGTAWQAYNAITEYLTHDYGRSQDSRLNAQWFGENAALSKRALDAALAL